MIVFFLIFFNNIKIILNQQHEINLKIKKNKMNIKKNESKWGQFFCKTDKYFSLKSDGMRFADAIAVDLMI